MQRLDLIVNNNQGMGNIEYGKIYGIYLSSACFHLFDGPSCNILENWRVQGRLVTNGSLFVVTLIKSSGFAAKAFRRGVLRLLARRTFRREQ